MTALRFIFRFWFALACFGWSALLLSFVLVIGENDSEPAQPSPATDIAQEMRHVPEPPLHPRADHRLLLDRLGVLHWHEQGHLGQHVKIAVLDTGFRDYRSFLGSALPHRVTVKSFRADGELEARDSQHGILCAEILHTLAPRAELLLINWELNEPKSFLSAVHWAREQGAKIITCSIIMPSWSDGEGGGPVNRTIARLVGDGDQAGDMLFFASAGNTAQRHWSGPFRPDVGGFHQWVDGECINELRPWGNCRVAVEVYGKGVEQFDLQVCDSKTGQQISEEIISWGNEEAESCTCLIARFLPEPERNYTIRLRRKMDDKLKTCPTGEKFHLVVLGGELVHFTTGGSIACPADGPGVLAVGAVDADQRRCYYSSCGPNSPLPKPDFVAEVPFPSGWRERPFAGTSAASPQAAALAAVLWSKYPHWTAAQVRDTLRQSAHDLETAGHDYQTGYGLIRLP